MAIFLLLLLLLVVALSAAGLLPDSRDGADWRPSASGSRRPPGR